MIRDVCIHVLDIPTTAVKQVILLLDEAEFVTLVTEGKTIKTVIPDDFIHIFLKDDQILA